ncbi:hypothetical protein [Streptomyces griseorubiginosus]|uniref:hypothetical protein n=1 Tax=Streptomyces griseorubiginosus TaxID=67304 RepID=UPI0033205292
MKITLDLPEYTVDPSDGHGDPYYDPGICAGCGSERAGVMVRLAPHGHLHATPPHEGEQSCLQKVVDGIAENALRFGPRAAWSSVAEHVAKYPSRHSASTIRAVITELLKR